MRGLPYRREKGASIYHAQLVVQRGEALGAFRVDEQQIFNAHAEAPGKVNARLVGKDVACFDDVFVAGREVGVLVHVQPQAVAKPVGEIWAIAGLFYYAAGGFVHIFTHSARLCRFKGGLVGRFYNAVNFRQPFRHALYGKGAGGVCNIAFALVFPAEINDDYIARQWSRNVTALAGLVLLFQVVVALYNGATFNQYYYGVCKQGAADVEKRQIGLVGGTLASAAAVAIVLGLAVYAYGNGREQGALYRQMLMQNAAIMGPQVQQALDESKVPASEEKLFLVGYIPAEELPDDLSAQGAGEQAMRSIRLFCDDDHTLGQVLDAAGVAPVFEGMALQEDGSAMGGLSCQIGETSLLAKVVIWPDDGTAAKAAVTGAGFVNGQSQEHLQASTNEAASLMQWLYRQAGMGDTPGVALRMQGLWVDSQGNYISILSSIIDGQDFQYHYVLREGDLLALYVSNEDIYGAIGLTEDDLLVWSYAPRNSSELTTEIYERAQ